MSRCAVSPFSPLMIHFTLAASGNVFRGLGAWGRPKHVCVVHKLKTISGGVLINSSLRGRKSESLRGSRLYNPGCGGAAPRRAMEEDHFRGAQIPEQMVFSSSCSSSSSRFLRASFVFNGLFDSLLLRRSRRRRRTRKNPAYFSKSAAVEKSFVKIIPRGCKSSSRTRTIIQGVSGRSLK